MICSRTASGSRSRNGGDAAPFRDNADRGHHADAWCPVGPGVGSSLPTSPKTVTLWFTQELEPAFSDVVVTNAAGQRVDAGKAQVPDGHPMELEVALKPLPPGTYKVSWHVVSVDTHRTEGTFTFQVGGG